MSFKKKAWKLTVPELMKLDPVFLQLCLRVHHEARAERQRPDMSVGWPNDSLREAFNALVNDGLAKAACVVYNTGHWHTGANDWLRPLMRGGTYWRFSAYADEVLRLNLGIRRGQSSKHGFHYEINDGLLKACAGNDMHWIAQPIGYANRETLEKAKAMFEERGLPNRCTRGQGTDWFNPITELVESMKKECTDDTFFHAWQDLHV